MARQRPRPTRGPSLTHHPRPLLLLLLALGLLALLALLPGCGLAAGQASPQAVPLTAPRVMLDSNAPGVPLVVVFIKGGYPVRVATDNLAIAAPSGNPIVAATVQLAAAPDNLPGQPVLEYLDISSATPAMEAGDLLVTFDGNTSTLAFNLSDPRGFLAQQADLAAARDAAGEVFRQALSGVTYQHVGKRPDPAPRPVIFRVADWTGQGSLPASAAVYIDSSPNLPPRVDLNGPQRPARSPYVESYRDPISYLQDVLYANVTDDGSFSVAYSSLERSTSVAICDPAATLQDEDSGQLASVTISLASTPDGAAESFSVDVGNTSISAAQNATASSGLVLVLSGVESTDAYQRVLTSVRYRNNGTLALVDNSGSGATQLRLTAGVRNISVVAVDTQGASARAAVYIAVSLAPRVGPNDGGDATIAPAPACSGHGYLDYFNELGVGDPDLCVCEPHYEGDRCEIPPCAGNGNVTESILAPRPGGVCECAPGWSGPICGVPCSGHGIMSALGCRCAPGWVGVDCSLSCGGCDQTYGNCTLTADSVLAPQLGPDNTIITTYDPLASTVLCTCLPDPRGVIWTGNNCNVPCPCGPSAVDGASHGNCTLVVVTGLGGLQSVEPVCKCLAGWMGSDCGSPCLGCNALRGTCELPGGYVTFLESLGLEGPTDPSLTGGAVVALPARVASTAVCRCDNSSLNAVNGQGYTGAGCNVPCKPCLYGDCASDGACVCRRGFVGETCGLECNGAGLITFPAFNSTYNASDFDNLPLVPGNDNTNNSGLFDARALYGPGFASDRNSSLAYCACNTGVNALGARVAAPKINDLGFFGYAGPFCETSCPDCNFGAGSCEYNGTAAVCVCDTVSLNGVSTFDGVGRGYTGPVCTIPCQPCFNGTCDASPKTTGGCLCRPGYTGLSCSIECGLPGTDSKGNPLGSHGRLDPALYPLGLGLDGSTAGCVCDAGWTGPLCQYPCPFPYDPAHGICVPKNTTDGDYGLPWKAEVICNDGWVGLPAEGFRLPANSWSDRVNCSVACQPCAHGTCQPEGECLCEYGRIWQGPLGPNAQGGAFGGVSPYMLQGSVKDATGSVAYNADIHSCATLHPCRMNGEWFNGTCGADGMTDVLNGTAWVQLDAASGGGFGCNGTLNGTTGRCDGGRFLIAMPYVERDPTTGAYLRSSAALASFKLWGAIVGGTCATALGPGMCLCDNIARGRFAFPSSVDQPSKKYNFYFQGWAGADCSQPCLPCSANGYCDPTSGVCTCHPGWAGYRCLIPCEPCASPGGTCQPDGTCLCAGVRRLREGSYALRLARDPFYLEKGIHTYLPVPGGATWTEYIPPHYTDTATIEDYLWEAEFQCGHRPECTTRLEDTHLPFRPNQTYFRYGPPIATGGALALATLVKLDARILSLQQSVDNLPSSLNMTAICTRPGIVNVPGSGDACLQDMQARLWGRTNSSCGSNWDTTRPGDCDSVLKAEYIEQTNKEIGSLLLDRLDIIATNVTGSESAWLRNNLNERARLMDTVARGSFEPIAGVWNAHRSPDYYSIWIVNALIYGVASGPGAHAGWDCGVPCAPCDAEHGTCQYDGSCECEPGWYGPACNVTCACHLYAANNTLAEGIANEQSFRLGYSADSHGLCQRDGSCRCIPDTSGLTWTGEDCNTQCALCAHGHCGPDGACVCDTGWDGVACSVPQFTEMLPCNYSHGMGLLDGTCRCLRGWTGLDCSHECDPCVHGDCEMDGSCTCRLGWTLPDCSKHIGQIIVASNFSEGPGGWRSYNNTCRSGGWAPVASAVPDLGDPLLVPREACKPAAGEALAAGAGGGAGEGGLTWTESRLQLVDMLPADASSDDVAYLRAPPSFLGNQMAAYAANGTLVYALHVAGASAQLPRPALAPLEMQPAPPDVLLLGGRLRYSEALVCPLGAFAARNATGVDAAGLEIDSGRTSPAPALCVPMADLRNMTKFEAYNWSRALFPELPLNLHWTKARLAATIEEYVDTPQLALALTLPPLPGRPPGACAGDRCVLNFNVELTERANWTNWPFVPAGFGWASGLAAEFVTVREGTRYYPTSATDGGAAGWTLERGDGPEPPRRGRWEANTDTPFELGGWVLGRFDPPNDPTREVDYSRADWDVVPEVHRAVQVARGNRTGQAASREDLLWTLGSLTEILIRADYYCAPGGDGTGLRPGNALGPGESVRLDFAAIAAGDPYAPDATPWAVQEMDGYVANLELITGEYKSAFLNQFVADYREAQRRAVCSGNGLRDAAGGCACDGLTANLAGGEGWVGAECQLPCPACINGTCAVGSVNGTVAAVCACSAGYVGASCALACPACAAGAGACALSADGRAARCACAAGRTGPLCAQECPPCVTGSCGGDDWRVSPRDGQPHGVCACVAANATSAGTTGALCELACPTACVHGACSHALAGRFYDELGNVSRRGDITVYSHDAFVSDIVVDTALCLCDAAAYVDYAGAPVPTWAGADCTLPCPGTQANPRLRGAGACLGRGTCVTSVDGASAVCDCVQGFLGDMCESTRLQSDTTKYIFNGTLFTGACGDNIRADWEACDDGNVLSGDGCDDKCAIEANYICRDVPRSDVTPLVPVAAALASVPGAEDPAVPVRSSCRCHGRWTVDPATGAGACVAFSPPPPPPLYISPPPPRPRYPV